MIQAYRCGRCGESHSLSDEVGRRHLAYALSAKEFGGFLDFASTAGAHAYITENTQQYVRDVQVFEVLGDKFSRSGIFAGREAASNWLTERVAVNADNVDQILRRLQGDGAGEVDALRQINGSLRGLVHRAEFITDASGHVPANTAGVDLQVVNRFTGEVVERIQVKSNWSSDPTTLRQTLSKFLSGPGYDESVTLAGPKELIEQAREMGIPNRLVVVSDVDGNRISGERLRTLVEEGGKAVDGRITLAGVAERAGQGAIVGAAVAATIAGISTYIAYRRGEISGTEAFRRVGVEASKGAVIGGALGGVSVLFPPGAIGIGIGIVVGAQLRRVVDIAYGKGAYLDIVRSMGAVEASLASTATGIAVIQDSTRIARHAQRATVESMLDFAETSIETDDMLERLRVFQRGGE
ncbi:MAG: hypothetical protein KF901_01340 [Myxococcales bacterium]|nr:hypothetical protein [Myxococcales bacterium]